MDTVFNLTLMRHGRSRADDEGVYEGRYDSPLTEVGLAQVRARAKEWQAAGVRFDRIVASPLQRTLVTAEMIAAALSVPLETDADWMEINTGPIAGLPFAEANQRYPRPAFRNPYTPIAGTGESEWELFARAARAVDRVMRMGLESILVVAHGGVLNYALRTMMGAAPYGNRQGFSVAFSDTGFVRLTYQPDRHIWTLRELQGPAEVD
ncbi:MAG: histidine phosphatase family protein [Anaerolineaceae bacterium]|nr:histidine phosphatase family protein [Anaerolineaceae bacterium]